LGQSDSDAGQFAAVARQFAAGCRGSDGTAYSCPLFFNASADFFWKMEADIVPVPTSSCFWFQGDGWPTLSPNALGLDNIAAVQIMGSDHER